MEAMEINPSLMTRNEIHAEITKWREFGYLLAESYDQLKRKYVEQTANNAKSYQITEALKEQINKLKALLNHSSAENRNLRDEVEKLTEENSTLQNDKEMLEKQFSAKCQEKEVLDNEKSISNKLVQQLNEKIKKLKSEISTAKIEQKNKDSSCTEEATDRQTQFFKKMSEKNLEQCGTLAEQVICLRNDLDRSNLDILKIQKQRSSSVTSFYNGSPAFALRKSESNFELLKPDAPPPKPQKLETWSMAGHSRGDSKSEVHDENDVNRSFVVPRTSSLRSKKLAGLSAEHYKTAPASRMHPPRAPLVSEYHSNTKQLMSNKGQLKR